MFCNNCGKPIFENLKYCNYCGTKLELSITTVNQQQQIEDPQTHQKLEETSGSNNTKKVIGVFLVWVLIQLVLLLVNWNSNLSARDSIWPFSENSELGDYDLTEFLLYTIVPLFGFIIFILFKDSKDTKISKLEKLKMKYDLKYERDYLFSIFGIVLLIFSIVFFHYYNNPDGLLSDVWIRGFIKAISLIIRLVVVVSVTDLAKKLNRSSFEWGLFAFFLPSIVLILIGLQRKLLKKELQLEENANSIINASERKTVTNNDDENNLEIQNNKNI